MNYEVLLYYKFHRIIDPQAFRDEHHAMCQTLGLKGRIYVAKEGLNGTVAGAPEKTLAYKTYLRSIPGFEDIAFKSEWHEAVPFEKLKTKVRPTIVNLGLSPDEDVDPSQATGKCLSPAEWRRTLENDADFVLLDIRNNYESAIGHFKGAYCPDLGDFTAFRDWLPDLEKDKDKKILMYCTGGIRCEKFSSFLLSKGFKDVNQLEGGILNYAKEENGTHFEGRCFVFDDRLAVDVSADSPPIAKCLHCGCPEDRYVNCANMECNRLFIVCDNCAQAHQATCCDACFTTPLRRPFDQNKFRLPFRGKGFVFPELGRRKVKLT